MKCDKCENEATVHEVMIKGGKKHERHLCEQCARAIGVAPKPALPVSQLLTQFIAGQAQQAAAAKAQGASGAGQAGGTASAAAACGSCGMTFAQFRAGGLLGCAECYRAFEGQLTPLLARAHEGGVQHVGKVPRRLDAAAAEVSATGDPARSATSAKAAQELAEQLTVLKRQLGEAVAAEQYERAAMLRDEVRRIEVRAAAIPDTSAEARPRARTMASRTRRPGSARGEKSVDGSEGGPGESKDDDEAPGGKGKGGGKP